MGDVLKYDGIKIEKGSATKVVDPLTVEQALEIQINGKAFTVVMQTPGDEEELATGLLFAEDVIGKNTEIQLETTVNENGEIDHINALIPEDQIGDGYLSSRSLLSVSSCGICGKQSLEDLPRPKSSDKEIQTSKTDGQYTVDELLEMQTKMVEAQTNFKMTGGCHGVAAFNQEGELQSIHEDIGRHNAMDKVVGDLIRQNKLGKAK